MSVDDFLKKASPLQKKAAEQRFGDLRGRRKTELDLWEKWNTTGRTHADLEPLLQSLDPVIEREATKRLRGLGGSMPKSALKQELRTSVLRALETYDPNRGASLFTHINNGFRATSDVIAGMRNPKYTPRKVTELYQTHDNVRNELANELGRQPTLVEIQQRMPLDARGRRVKVDDLRRLRSATAPEMFSDLGPELSGGNDRRDIGVHAAFDLLKPKMSEPERQFFSLHYPDLDEEKEPASIKQIAKLMKLPEHSVYRIKQRVEKQLGVIIKKT